MVDNVFDFTLARQALEELINTTPPVAYTITAEPQERKHPKTAADAFTSHTVFAITDVFEADISISAKLPQGPRLPVRQSRRYAGMHGLPGPPGPQVPRLERQGGNRALLELYMDKLLEEGYDDYIIKPGDEDYVDLDFPFIQGCCRTTVPRRERRLGRRRALRQAHRPVPRDRGLLDCCSLPLHASSSIHTATTLSSSTLAGKTSHHIHTCTHLHTACRHSDLHTHVTPTLVSTH
jgi:hypothetical protein